MPLRFNIDIKYLIIIEVSYSCYANVIEKRFNVNSVLTKL